MSFEDDERSGRPATSTSPQMVQVEPMVRLDRRVTINELADSIDASFGSVQAILTSTLGMHRIAAKFVPRLLTNDQKEHRVDVCKDLLHTMQEDPLFTSRLITGDETWVYGYDPNIYEATVFAMETSIVIKTEEGEAGQERHEEHAYCFLRYSWHRPP